MFRKIVIISLTISLLFGFSANSQTLVKKFTSIGSSANLNGNVLFAADDGVHGIELWKTDGTSGGSSIVKDINPGPGASNVASLFAFNNKLYFSATDGIHGVELWQSDGTAAGTKMLKDINTVGGNGNDGSIPLEFTVFKGALYFTALQDGNYYTLWKTDGTAAGTVMITDDSDYTYVAHLTVVGNSMYFTKGQTQLWVTDGTTAGTKQINVDDYYTVEMLHNVNNELVFITSYTYEHYDIRLYKLNPSDNKPVLLHPFKAVTYGNSNIDNITAVGNKFYFSIRTSDANDKAVDALWKSDGTAAGTDTVRTFGWENHLSGSSNSTFTVYNNKLYFVNGRGSNLWTTDGTYAGTIKLSNATVSTTVKPIIYNNKLYFNGNNQLWKFDGANAAAEIQQPTGADMLFDGNGKLYFVIKAQFNADLWTNTTSGQLQVTSDYRTLVIGDTKSFTSKADSTVTSAVTVKNIGNKPLVFSEISVAGNSFYINGHVSQTLMPGAQAGFNLLYSPNKEVPDNGKLVIKTNDNGGQNNFICNLTGTAAGTAVNRNDVPADGLLKAIAFADSIPTFTLSNTTVAENAAVNTTVGAFVVANATAPYQFQLVSGTGGDDNGSFKIENGQLKTLIKFNFNNKSTYTIRVKAGNSTTSLEKSFVLQVSNVQTSLDAATCSASFRDLNYMLNDVAYAGTRIVGVGSAGKIIISDDNGKSWKQVSTGISADVNQVRFPDSKTGYTLSQGVILMKTENGGDDWFPLELPASAYPYFSNIYFYSVNVGYVYGGAGVYKTIDGGRHWAKSFAALSDGLYSASFIDENNGFICGSARRVIHTTDGGTTWETVNIGVIGENTSLTNIVFVNASTGYITSSAGDVLQTVDGGKTWAKAGTVQTDGATNRMYFTNVNTGYILTGFNQAVLYKTTDGGKTWLSENINSGGTFLGLAINKDNFCLVGHAEGLGYTSPQGNIIFLKNGSGSWTRRSYLGNDNYVGGNLFASGTGYVLGAQNLKTTDAGITWNPINITADYYSPVQASAFVDDKTGFYADYYHIFKTTDGGDTWVKKYTDSIAPIRKMYWFDSLTGFCFSEAYLYKTANGGESWDRIKVAPGDFGIPDINFIDRKTGYIADYPGILKTTDGGNTWALQDLGVNLGVDPFLTAVYFIDAQTGFVGGNNGMLLRTIDGGKTWKKIENPMLFFTVAFQFLDKTHGYALNKNFTGVNEVYETTDAGLTWSRIYQTWTNITVFKLSNGQLFLAGDSGSIVKLGNTPNLPVNAGYILGDTTVAVLNKVIYSVPAIANTYYRWSTSGDANIEYQNNNIIIAWKKGGQYTLQATPYNSCGNSQARTITVDVEDMPDPQITGPDSVLSHSINVLYGTTAHDNTTYQWAATGGTNLNITNNQASINWGEPGKGTISVTETSQKLNLKKSAVLNVFIQKSPFTLPENNFTVKINDVTCKGSNNGIVTIKAQQALNYTVAVTSPSGFNKNYSFTDSLKVDNLVPGTYNACIGIKDSVNFQRCYTAEVTEPKDLALYSTINADNKTLTLNLSGADSYFIELNGNKYQTNNTQLNLPLADGANKLKVYTDRLCQGVIEKYINLNKITLFPDPFVDSFSINLGSSPETTVGVEIANALGKSLYKKQLVNNNGQISIDATGFDKGIYLLKLTLGQTSTVFKIAKK